MTPLQPAGASPVEVKALQDQVVDLTDSRDFYKRRVDLLQQWQSKMRDPERTICCDIIANGQTLPPENAGNRYAVQPSQAGELSKYPVALSRDDTEHGVYYYKASEVDAIIAAINAKGTAS